MSIEDYQISRDIEGKYDFYALIMTAMRQADSTNAEILKAGFPAVWEDLDSRYSAPAGFLPKDILDLDMERTYRGARLILNTKTRETKTAVLVNGVELDPKPSQKIHNHSPTGFEWGYLGSGPAQLALAILLDLTGSERLSLGFYQEFKHKFVGTWDKCQFRIESSEIILWLTNTINESTHSKEKTNGA